MVLGLALALGSREPGDSPSANASPPVEAAGLVENLATNPEAAPVPSSAPEQERVPPPRAEVHASAASGYDQEALSRVLEWGVQKSEKCHRQGRVLGTVRAAVTFGPDGKVRNARLDGEPIASAPVGQCIRATLHWMVIPPFSGPKFTVTREITLR